MDIKEIRRENLESLLIKHTVAYIAKTADVSPGFLYQILTDVKTRKGTVRGIGDKTARKIELGFNKQRGWMDERHREGGQPTAVQESRSHHANPEAHPQLLADIYSKVQKLDENGLKELDSFVDWLLSKNQLPEKKRAIKARTKS
jgi:hypothetical protein